MKESEESEVTQSCPTLCDPMDYIACQAPPSMGFPRQEYWSGLPFPSPGDLPDPGMDPGSPASQEDPLPSEPPGNPTYSLSQMSHKKPEKKKSAFTYGKPLFMSNSERI